MKRIIAILMLATTAHAQVWLGYTNEISGVTGPLLYTNFIAGQFRVTVAATDGGTPIDLSVDRVSLQVQDTRDNKLVVSNTCVTIDAYNYRGEGTLFASPEPYTLKVIVYPSGNPDANYPIYWASLTVTSAPSAGGGGSVTVVISNQHMASLRSDGSSTGRVPVSRSDGGVDLLPWAAGGGDGNVVATNTGTEGQVLKSSGNGNTGYWGNAASGGGESNVYRHIGSYTYTGGETSVTFAFDPYCRVDLDMAGQFSPTNTAGVTPALGVQVNGHPWVYRTDMKHDTYADAHPNAAYSFAASYPGTSNLFVLGGVGLRNQNVVGAGRSMTAARWTFMASARGIHMEGRGHMSYASDFSGDYTFDSFGSLQTNDYVNNNAITQLVVICMNMTNGQYLVSSQSNATFRLRGVRCD